MVENKVFNGTMNLDDSNDILPSRHHNDALNIRFRGGGNNTIAENINGNTLIINSLPSGGNQCIGSIFDNVKNRVYYFNYNSFGRNGIYYYDTISRTITKVLESFSNSSYDIFNFSPLYPIVSVNILYKDDVEGDVLLWTDRFNRPQSLNIKDALSNTLYSSGTNWQSDYLSVARQMPLLCPICNYADDATLTLNNLKNKLYQFRYRWIYRDNSKSTWSPWSKLFAPKDIDSLSIETDPTKNNNINVIVNTGPSDCTKIEIATRQSLSASFGNPILVSTIDKVASSIADNSTYTYIYYNDSAYEYVDNDESILLFDYVPKKANTQELLNGNLLVYGGITEGNTFDKILNVSKSLSLIDNSNVIGLTIGTNNHGTFCNETIPPFTNYMTFSQSFILSGGLANVASVTLNFYYTGGTIGTAGTIVSNSITYTVLPGDTIISVLNGLQALMPVTGFVSAVNTTGTATSNTYTFSTFTSNIYLEAYSIGITPGDGEYNNVEGDPVILNGSFVITPVGGSVITNDINTSCYKHNSRYTFGMVYFDEFGITNGIVTNESMKVITPEISSTGVGTAPLTIPNIKFSVNHTPPSWAKYFSFARTNNLTVSEFKTIVTDKTYKDAYFGYLDITGYQTNTSSLPAYDFAKGDRVRICSKYGATQSIFDTAILDLITDAPSGSTFPTTGFFIKLEYNVAMSAFGPTNPNYYIEVYTPALNTNVDNQIFYEFGEQYRVIYDSNGNLVHDGQQQSQIFNTGGQPTAARPAIFNFSRGDIYQKKRNQYIYAVIGGIDVFILDKSVSDRFDSKVIGNGRAFVIDKYAKEIYNPTLVRYGDSYQQGTLINGLNRFYPVNFEEYDRQKGDIQRFKLREKLLRIFQSRGTGVVNIYATEMTNQDGTSNLIGSTKILNPINYYSGQYGIGNQYCSLTSSSIADYYVDPIKGYHIRLSQDGNTPLSELYKGQYYFPSKVNKYLDDYNRTAGGIAKILGIYDDFEEEYISIFQQGTKGAVTLTPLTVGFSEKKNCYTSFYSFNPEFASCAENVLITWLNGNLYVHDSATKNNFYGVQYKSSLTLVFNENNLIRKTFDAISTDSNFVWNSATIGDINTSLEQTSNLVESDYENREGFLHAALMRDFKSIKGIIEGDYLKGSWIEIKLNNNASYLVYLSGIYLNYQQSGRNL